MAQDQVRSCAVALYGVTEKLKSENQMEWVTQMNNMRSRATEIANKNISSYDKEQPRTGKTIAWLLFD